jgi:hypothetical protein
VRERERQSERKRESWLLRVRAIPLLNLTVQLSTD